MKYALDSDRTVIIFENSFIQLLVFKMKNYTGFQHK